MKKKINILSFIFFLFVRGLIAQDAIYYNSPLSSLHSIADAKDISYSGSPQKVKNKEQITKISYLGNDSKESFSSKKLRVESENCILSVAPHGAIAPGTNQGFLKPDAFMNSSTINDLGQVAFISIIEGDERNQGVFIADKNGIKAIAIGCGLMGGDADNFANCGDPSPIGGHFSGFYFGTFFIPDINNSGDVLFLSDIYGGTSSLGLFLYQASNNQIIKIAAEGDLSPDGDTITALGMGSLNNNGTIVFLASVGHFQGQILQWKNNNFTKVAAIGDPSPGNSTYLELVYEYLVFKNGKELPVGPVPDINDKEQICFNAAINENPIQWGIIVRSENIDNWYVKSDESTPAGGVFSWMQAASINNQTEIAFFTDVKFSSDEFKGGWFAGKPNNFRKVIMGGDPIDGVNCMVLAYSRNPMQSIDDGGNVIFWTDLNINGGEGRIILNKPSGEYKVIVQQDDPFSNGETIGNLDGWPSLCNNKATINSGFKNSSVLSSHMVFLPCGENNIPTAEYVTAELDLSYPNPCKYFSTIGFYLPGISFVKLEIMDVIGNIVNVLVSEKMAQGNHTVLWDVTNQKDGIYIYRLNTTWGLQSRILLVKH